MSLCRPRLRLRPGQGNPRNDRPEQSGDAKDARYAGPNCRRFPVTNSSRRRRRNCFSHPLNAKGCEHGNPADGRARIKRRESRHRIVLNSQLEQNDLGRPRDHTAGSLTCSQMKWSTSRGGKSGGRSPCPGRPRSLHEGADWGGTLPRAWTLIPRPAHPQSFPCTRQTPPCGIPPFRNIP